MPRNLGSVISPGMMFPILDSALAATIVYSLMLRLCTFLYLWLTWLLRLLPPKLYSNCLNASEALIAKTVVFYSAQV